MCVCAFITLMWGWQVVAALSATRCAALAALTVDDLWDNDQEALWNRLVEGASSPLCEVLGLQQRQWLQEQLQDSNAALRVIGSGSVLAGWCRDMRSCNHVLDCACVLAGSVACFSDS